MATKMATKAPTMFSNGWAPGCLRGESGYMRRLDSEARARVVTVGGDLDYLAKIPRDRAPTLTEVRLLSAILRRLCTDGLYGRAWRDLGRSGKLSIVAPDLDAALAKVPPHHLLYAWAGGAALDGLANHRGYLLVRVPRAEWRRYGTPDVAVANLYPAGYPQPENRRMTLAGFLSGTSMAVGGQQPPRGPVIRVARADVIKHVANKLGGIHLTSTRPPLTEHSSSGEVAAHALDLELLRVGNLSGPHYEAFSIAIALGTSEDAQEFVGQAKRIAPEAFEGDPSMIQFWSPEGGGKWEEMKFDVPR